MQSIAAAVSQTEVSVFLSLSHVLIGAVVKRGFNVGSSVLGVKSPHPVSTPDPCTLKHAPFFSALWYCPTWQEDCVLSH